MKKTIEEIIRELKDYEELKNQLDAEIKALKEDVIEILKARDEDEFTCEDGKVTYRPVISKRFATTEFKRLHGDLYEAFTKTTENMRFTLN